MRKLQIIKGLDIKKEIPNNNNVYVKLTEFQAKRLLSYSYFDKKFELKNGLLDLNLPKFKDTSLYDKLKKEPIFNELIDMMLVVSAMIYQGRFDKPKIVNKLKDEIKIYESEILELDNKLDKFKEVI